MNAPRTILLILLATVIAGAQDNPAAAPAQTEMQKWIATTDAQWQAAYKRDVTDAHEAEAKKLMLQYVNMLEDAIAKSSKASDLEGAVALRTEQKRFGDTQLFPEQDEPGDPAAVKQARAAIRALLAQAAKNSAVRAKALHGKYDQVLAQAQAQLTQRQRLDDALLVKKQRDEVAATWLTSEIKAGAGAGKPPELPAKVPSTVVVPKEPVAKPDTASLEKRLVGTRWKFPVKGQPAENQWIEFRGGGALQIGWSPTLRTWRLLSEGRVLLHPYQTDNFSFVLSIDSSLRNGKFLEGEFKGQKFTRAK